MGTWTRNLGREDRAGSLTQAEADERAIDGCMHAGHRHPSVIGMGRRLSGRGPDDGLVAVEGIGICAQLAERLPQMRVRELLLAPECISSPDAAALAARLGAVADRTFLLSARVMNAISRRDDCQGMMLLAALPHRDPAEVILRERLVLVVMDGLETPGNIGTILRSCDGAGVDAVLHCNRRVRMNHPEILKASTGALFDMPVRDAGDTDACATWLLDNGIHPVLADPHGLPCDSRALAGSGWKRMALVVGNERYGVHAGWSRYPVSRIAIPMRGRCDSLNVGVAASIMLYGLCDAAGKSGTEASGGSASGPVG